jgi:hypothetical protein
MVSSNIPSLIVTSQFCSIPPGGTATGSASGSAKTPGPAGKSQTLYLVRPPSRAAARRKRKLIRRQTKVQTVGPLARNQGFESISLQRRVKRTLELRAGCAPRRGGLRFADPAINCSEVSGGMKSSAACTNTRSASPRRAVSSAWPCPARRREPRSRWPSVLLALFPACSAPRCSPGMRHAAPAIALASTTLVEASGRAIPRSLSSRR